VLPVGVACAVLCATACSQSPVTEIVVVVDSDIAVPAELDEVTILVDGAVGGTRTASRDLSASRGAGLPVTLGLVHPSGPLGPITARAVGSVHRGGVASIVVERTARTSFVDGRTVVLRLDLLGACSGVTCADASSSCGADGCAPIDIAPGSLSAWTGTPSRLDAGAPALDAGPRGDASGLDAGGFDAGRLDSGARDAGPDAPAGGDGDHDGVPDATDNCPDTSNPEQENEDGDRFGDACDPCPPIADDAPPDSDSDGVADACDPAPTTGGDHIALFEGFHHGLPAGWTMFGAWSTVGDSVTHTSSTGDEALLLTSVPLGTRERIATHLTVLGIYGGSQRTTGVVDVFAAPAGLLCAAGRNTDMDGTVDGIYLFDLTSGSPRDVARTSFRVGTSYDVVLDRSDTSYTCTGTPGGGRDFIATTAYTPQPPMPLVGLRSRSAAATYDWLMVVTD